MSYLHNLIHIISFLSSIEVVFTFWLAQAIFVHLTYFGKIGAWRKIKPERASEPKEESSQSTYRDIAESFWLVGFVIIVFLRKSKLLGN